MELDQVFLAVGALGLLLLAGKVIRNKLSFLRNIYLPSSIVGGTIALLAGPELFGALAEQWRGHPWPFGLWSEGILEVWGALPGLLINLVFAGLFLGKPLSPVRKIWHIAGPMLVHGQTMAWGQYVLGISLALLVLTPVFDISVLAGALIEISFEGGHGTAAGLQESFRELGFAEGRDLALGLATIGVVLGVILGTVLVNWGVKHGHLDPADINEHTKPEPATRPGQAEGTASHHYHEKSIEPLSVQLGLFAISIGLGWGILELLILLEENFLQPLGWPELIGHVPLFPLAMIGGVIVQILATKFGLAGYIDRKLVNRITGVSLDFLIIAALGAISLRHIGTHFQVFLILATAGILWNLFGFFVLARLLFPRHWVANGLANFGQGMGMTVIGLLLIKMSDPQGKTKAMEAFGYKQLLFEPIVGGGIFTAVSLPLIAQFGPVPVLIGVSVIMLAWLLTGLLLFGPWQKKNN